MADHVMADFEAYRRGAHKAAICQLIAAKPTMTIEEIETYLEDDEVALEAKSSQRKAPPRVVSSGDPNNIDGKIAAFLGTTASATKREILAGAKIAEGQFRPAMVRLLKAKAIKKQGRGRGASYRAA
jgi:hypothetical protein